MYSICFSEEDNDDLVEILNRKCPRFKELYGDYYISEIIGQRPNSQRKVIVAQVRLYGNRNASELIHKMTVKTGGWNPLARNYSSISKHQPVDY